MTNRFSNIFLLGLFLLSAPLFGMGKQETQSILIASGGGYKKPVSKVCEEFSNKTGIQVDTIFGNMQTVSMQIKESGLVGLLVGDRKFLSNPNLGVDYEEYLPIGQGKLVLAYRKGVEISNAEDLESDSIERISLPDIKKAIYGMAGKEYMENNGIWGILEPKIIMAATVPQVSSYLISGEVDAGFINLTDAIAIADQIGGYIVLEDGYSKIEIVAGLVEGYGDDEGIQSFMEFLSTEQSSEIFSSYGL